MDGGRKYLASHPWLTFKLDLRNAPPVLWAMLGECRSKCGHIRFTPIRPEIRQELMRVYFAKGVQGSAAIEGNSLSVEEVRGVIEGDGDVPPSREYQQRDIENLVRIINEMSRNLLSGEWSALTPEIIKHFHRELFSDVETEEHNPLGEIPGMDIGVGRYRGAPRSDCEHLLEKLCDWLNGDWSVDANGKEWIPSICAAILKAVIGHLYFVWIHPFGDGNGRTARLIEAFILLRAGVPFPSAQLLSNHYNLTRDQYYRELDRSSKGGGSFMAFATYAIEGLRDGLVEQIEFLRGQQFEAFFRDFIHQLLGKSESVPAKRQKALVLALLEEERPVAFEDLTILSKELASYYNSLSEKTLQRDLRELEEKYGLIVHAPGSGYQVNDAVLIDALPPGRQEYPPSGSSAEQSD